MKVTIHFTWEEHEINALAHRLGIEPDALSRLDVQNFIDESIQEPLEELRAEYEEHLESEKA